MLRHFAFFDVRAVQMMDRDGHAFAGCAWVREAKGEVEPPDGPADPDWQDRVSGRQPGEICLDVTSFDYPLGDFCWMVYRPYDATEPGTRGLLDSPMDHTFVQVNRHTLDIVANSRSPRPIRSTDDVLVVDVTGTPLEALYGRMFGRLRGGRFVPASGRPALPDAACDALAASLATLDSHPVPIRRPHSQRSAQPCRQ